MSKTEALIVQTIYGLTDTAVEKLCVLGNEDGFEEIRKIREMVKELVYFWELDERYIDQFDMDTDTVKKGGE